MYEVSIKIQNWTYKNLLEAKLKISHFKLSINLINLLFQKKIIIFNPKKANLLY